MSEINKASKASKANEINEINEANKKRVLLYAVQRGGSNHLAAQLHYQNKIFAYSERVLFPKSVLHDVFGFKSEHEEYNVQEKFNSAEAVVFNKANTTPEYDKPQNVVYMPRYVKHHESKRDYYILLTRNPETHYADIEKVRKDVKGQEQFLKDVTLKDIVQYNTMIEELAEKYKNPDAEFKVLHITYAELLKEPNAVIHKIMRFIDVQCKKVMQYKDYFGKRDVYPRGYGPFGGYNPALIVKKDE